MAQHIICLMQVTGYRVMLSRSLGPHLAKLLNGGPCIIIQIVRLIKGLSQKDGHIEPALGKLFTENKP